MLKALKGLLFIVGLCFTIAASAQTGSVRGFVYEKESGEPVMFANVYLLGTTYGGSTDINGFFTLTQIPAGKYRLAASFIGYDSLSVPVEVKPGKIFNVEMYLAEGSEVLQEVVVSAEREEQRTEVQTGVTKISAKEIKQLPTVGGQPDLAQYLQVLPGVIFTGDQGGQLYIRGGAPIHNKVLLDGMVVYNPFHSIGFFSVFDTDIIRSADVYSGGFGAQYGGRISSVMDISTREGNKGRLGGKIGASPFGSKLLLEGPIGRKDDNDRAKTSFLMSAKTSYLEQTSKTLYSYVDTAGLPFNYTDIYTKLSMSGNNGTKANIFAFNFNDKVDYAASSLDWKSSGFGTKFVLVPGATTTLIEGSFAYSNYDIAFREGNQSPKTSSINGFNAGMDFTYFLKGSSNIGYGFEFIGFSTNFKVKNASNKVIEQQDNNTELAGYIRYKFASPRFLFEPGIRFNYYASIAEAVPEPRVGAKFNVTENFRLKASAGFYSQNLIAGNSNRDVVNLFYGFLSGDVSLVEEYRGEEVDSKLQKGRHLIAGFEYNVSDKLDVNVEGYIKEFNQMINLNRNNVFPNQAPYTNINSPQYVPESLRKDFIVERGVASGVDFVVKYRTTNASLWAVYSLGFSSRADETSTYRPHYDRRHNVNLVGNYKWGEDQSWSLDMRWNLGSGFPFTQTQGFTESPSLNDGVNSDYASNNGDLHIVYAELNGGRLPYYHRLDMSVSKVFEISKYSSLDLNVGVTNLYNRENIFYFDRVKYETVYQLPVLPSFGVNLTF